MKFTVCLFRSDGLQIRGRAAPPGRPAPQGFRQGDNASVFDRDPAGRENHLPWHGCSEGVSVVQAQRGSSQPQFNVLVVRPFPLLWLLGMLAVRILCDLFRGMLGVRIWWDCAVFDRRLGPDLARVAHLDRIVSVWESLVGGDGRNLKAWALWGFCSRISRT